MVLNFGGPREQAEVEPFLFELFNDPDVIQLPVGTGLQRKFAATLSARRAPIVVPHYEHIGGSPLVPTTMAQVEALIVALGSEAPKVHVGMRYTAPTIAAVADALAADPPERIVALALYPHYSITTTGSHFNALSSELRRVGLHRLPVHYVPAFYDHPDYIEAMVARIHEATPQGRQPHLLFSAHGIPSSYAKDKADPYPDQIKDSVRMIMRAFGDRPYSLAFQSRVGPVRWLEPSTEAELMRLAEAGVTEVLVVALSFVTEGIETLQEIDVQFREVAEARGLTMHRAPTVDTHPRFIECLADVVRRALADESHEGLGQHRCVRCLIPKPHAHRTKVQCLDCGHETPQFLLQLPPVRPS